MKFLTSKWEFDFQQNEIQSTDDKFILNAATSVNKLKAHFFETLAQLGELVQVDIENNLDQVQKHCLSDDVIFVSFHEVTPNNLACRLLQHTKGGLMLSGGFLDNRTFVSSTMNLVTTSKQKDQLTKSLGISSPLLGVFTPEINSFIFRLPTDKEKQLAKNNYNIKLDCFHILYAGRIISNKGICQLVKAVNLISNKNIRITIVGDFEPNFYIYQSNAYNTTFNHFFQREIVDKCNCNIILLPSKKQEELRELFWSSDCFLYPSFHEDENFGITPREAILSGVPVIATDFCGLSALSNAQLISTFSSLGGVRFSIYELRNAISNLINNLPSHQQIKTNREVIINECDLIHSKESLENACETLLNSSPNQSNGAWHSIKHFEEWIEKAPINFKKAIEFAKNEDINGLYVDGTGEKADGYSDSYLLNAIQSIYTTLPTIPKAKIGEAYSGFWRLSLWDEELALIEFGYPGPRIKRYNECEWITLKNHSIKEDGELLFQPKTSQALELIDDLILLGYLVPKNI